MDSLTRWLNWSSNETEHKIKREGAFKLFINDVENSVTVADLSPEMTLNEYLREKVNLPGTKFMCLEGGCGACVVTVSFMDPITMKNVTHSVNSCLIPIYKCFGWKIYVVDQIGSQKTGYHPIQKALVQYSGTQCGYCSSGMIMNMYALYERSNLTMEEVENSFGGNICRCTGYRPILAAFKSLAVDAQKSCLGNYPDIEDVPICKSDSNKCELICGNSLAKQLLLFENHETKWYKAFSVNEVLDIIRYSGNEKYMIVGGNTATGVYRRPKHIQIFIDIANVENLQNHSVKNDTLIIGANTTLTNTLELFKKMAKDHKMFAYLEKLAQHIDKIANLSVRNAGTLAGNLVTKHDHPEFPSDIFLIFEAVAATVTLVDTNHRRRTVTLTEFLSYKLKQTVIETITLPSYDESYEFGSYKIMKRAQNDHAIVNAAFNFQLSSRNTVKSSRIIYGGINPQFVHARRAEAYLIGKQLFDNSTLGGLFERLNQEIIPDHVLPDPSPKFRKNLAIALCYKFVLSIAPDGMVSTKNKTGGLQLVRPVSSGIQVYDSTPSEYPLTQPIPKLEALAQCSGKAQYIMDIPNQPHQLYAAFVLAKAPAHTVISGTDPSRALKLIGVISYFDKNDIPGDNNFIPIGDGYFNHVAEEIFCTGTVKYYFQPVGLIIATSQKLAEEAADLVEITYTAGQQKPLVTVRDVLKNNAKERIAPEFSQKATKRGNDVKHVIQGKFDIFEQYHFHMENQCVVVIPVEDGLNIYPSSQCLNLSQVAAAKALNIPVCKINVEIRRLGGAFGGKMTRNSLLSTAVAVASYKLQKPIKFTLPLETNMKIIGKRNPFTADYKIGVDNHGKIQYMEGSLYSDLGYHGQNDSADILISPTIINCYTHDTWNFNLSYVLTDKTSCAACRGPGTTQAVGYVESIMEEIALKLNLNPIDVRLQNLEGSDPKIMQYLEELIKWCNYNERREAVQNFNKANRWMKKGISVVPLKFHLNGMGAWHAVISIFEGDGSVSVTSSGIEMGQGINTKAAQVCAYSLGVPLNQVSIKPCYAFMVPNDQNTSTSLTSEVICFSIIRACEILKNRMKPVKDKMPNASWKDLVFACFQQNVDLQASYMCNKEMPELRAYDIYGATCVEVEVDILTGVYQILRADILEDTGTSMSPLVDLGQIEGAFVMGIGYWTSEEMIYDDQGQSLTNRSWNYKPPGAKDIPIDFRVKIPKNNPYPNGVLNSKATGEPPLNMAVAVPLAIRQAVASARAESDPAAEKWYRINGPSTVENTFMHSLNEYSQYKL